MLSWVLCWVLPVYHTVGAIVPYVWFSTWSRVLRTGHRHEHRPTRYRPSLLPHRAPRIEKPLFTDGCFDSLEICNIDGLDVREGGTADTEVKARDSPEDFAVHRSKPGKMIRV